MYALKTQISKAVCTYTCNVLTIELFRMCYWLPPENVFISSSEKNYICTIIGKTICIIYTLRIVRFTRNIIKRKKNQTSKSDNSSMLSRNTVIMSVKGILDTYFYCISIVFKLFENNVVLSIIILIWTNRLFCRELLNRTLKFGRQVDIQRIFQKLLYKVNYEKWYAFGFRDPMLFRSHSVYCDHVQHKNVIFYIFSNSSKIAFSLSFINIYNLFALQRFSLTLICRWFKNVYDFLFDA